MRRLAGLALLFACEATSSAPGPEHNAAPVALEWREVTSGAELSALAAEARASKRGLMLDVRADWCVPCRELESTTFQDPAMVAQLRDRFLVARLDVTDPNPQAEALQKQVGGTAMPWVMFWPMTSEDADSFAAGHVPPAAKTVSTFVSPQELLPLVTAVASP